MDSLAGLQTALGNQHLLALLHSRRLQLKSRSSSSDEFEVESDRASELVTKRVHSPIQRKCAGGGSCSCSKCSTALEVEPLELSSLSDRIQLQAKDSQPQNEKEPKADRRREHPSLIAEDDVPELLPGQMKKTTFLAQMRAVVCLTVDTALASTGNSSRGCPYVEKWLAF